MLSSNFFTKVALRIDPQEGRSFVLPTVLLQEQSRGWPFTDVTGGAGIQGEGYSWEVRVAAAPADFDHDGWTTLRDRK